MLNEEEVCDFDVVVSAVFSYPFLICIALHVFIGKFCRELTIALFDKLNIKQLAGRFMRIAGELHILFAANLFDSCKRSVFACNPCRLFSAANVVFIHDLVKRIFFAVLYKVTRIFGEFNIKSIADNYIEIGVSCMMIIVYLSDFIKFEIAFFYAEIIFKRVDV